MWQRLRILETNYGRDAGWYVEHDGRRVAVLTDCRFEEMFWDSYRFAAFTEEPALYSDEFWGDLGRLSFVSREFGIAAPYAFPAGRAAQVLREEGRLLMRGLYLQVPEYLWDGVALWVRRRWKGRTP